MAKMTAAGERARPLRVTRSTVKHAVPATPHLAPSISRSALSDSERRLRAIIIEYCPLIVRRLRRLCVSPNDIDDATQRVFFVLSKKLDSIAEGGECAYLLGTTLRVASELRRVEARRVRREVALDEDTASDSHTDDLIELKRARLLLDQVLSSMPSELALVFALSETEGLTALEISQRIGIPPGTVASRLRRARSSFREQARRLRAPLRRASSLPSNWQGLHASATGSPWRSENRS